MNEHQEQMLRRLLSLVVSAAHPVDDDKPRIMIGHGSGGLLFQGEALRGRAGRWPSTGRRVGSGLIPSATQQTTTQWRAPSSCARSSPKW